MGYHYAQVILAAKTGNTEDVNTNVFAVEAGSALTGPELDGWQAAIKQFYEDVQDAGGMCGRAQTGHVTKFIDIGGGPPNYPVREDSWSLDSTTPSADLPLEVNLCVSYKNVSSTSVKRARRRGRIYTGGYAETQNLVGRPTSTLVTALATAYKDYVDAVNVVGTLEAGVWSRVDGVVYPVEEIWVDNEWDTQRSRGGKALSRTTIVV